MSTPKAQAARTAPCRCALGCIAAPCRSIVSQRRVVTPYRDTKIMSRYKAMSRALGRITASCRALLLLSPARLLSRTLGHAHPAARPGPACRDTTHCIATKTRKWVVAHPNFFCTFFFVLLTVKPQFFFFKSSSRTSETYLFNFFSSIFFFYSSSSLPATSKMQ